MINRNDILSINSSLENMNPAEILYWLSTQDAGKVAITSSFQPQSLPLLYLVSRICPFVPVLFLDTGFHFRETLEYVDLLCSILDLNLGRVIPSVASSEKEMYKTNPDMCCYLRKVEPLQNELKGHDVWISGIRRDQTETRKHSQILSYDAKNDVLKLCPMANFSRDAMWNMCDHLSLPGNPLREQGYLSIGCEPCTQKSSGEDERSGRWNSSKKTECGLHLPEHLYENSKGNS